MCKSFILLTCLHFQDPYDEHQQPHNQMNQYESEYQKQKQQKSASFKKIEDEYSAMKAALLSSMDSEDECSDEGFPNQNPSHSTISFEALPQTLKSDRTHPSIVSGHPKVTPSKLNSSRSSLEESVSLNNPHGNNDQLVLDSKLKLGSSNADNVTHEDVLVRTKSSEGPSAANLNPGRVLDVSSVLVIHHQLDVFTNSNCQILHLCFNRGNSLYLTCREMQENNKITFTISLRVWQFEHLQIFILKKVKLDDQCKDRLHSS